ncbi:MAG: hypothetical protein IH614_09255 [Desulfuromonadales bacterium]|nr:hypothetical protein [Desulfuromonadales bacterium]
MKKYLLVGLGLAAGLVIALLISRPGTADALHVNAVGSDPGAYTGTITVVGITAAFAQNDPTVFGIMDVKELQCTTPGCNKLLVPVRYQGARPALGDELRVIGTFVPSGGGHLFVAEKITVVKNHKLEG